MLMSLNGTWKKDDFANFYLIFNKPNFDYGYLLVTLHHNNECRILFNELMLFFRRFRLCLGNLKLTERNGTERNEMERNGIVISWVNYIDLP